MTGPEHYRAGEAALAEGLTFQLTSAHRAAKVAEAHAHFAAAQVAATIDAAEIVAGVDVQTWVPVIT